MSDDKPKKPPISVSHNILSNLQEIRESGESNMFDYHAVMRIAFNRDMYETVVWLQDNKEKYIRGIFRGFQFVPHPDNATDMRIYVCDLLDLNSCRTMEGMKTESLEDTELRS